MKQLKDFKGESAIVAASKILGVILEMLQNPENKAVEGEENPIKLFTALMQNSPGKMREVFAILSEKEVAEYDCDGSEALMNIMFLANDPIILSLFISQGTKKNAESSASASANIEA